MTDTFTAETSIVIDAPAAEVWQALTDPAIIRKYMFGAEVESDWKEGGKIRYFGEYQGKPFEEKGEIKKIEPNKLLQATNYSSMTGKEDKPENYDLVTYTLEEKDGKTTITITQDNIKSEKAVEGSKANWNGVLQGMKKAVEE